MSWIPWPKNWLVVYEGCKDTLVLRLCWLHFGNGKWIYFWARTIERIRHFGKKREKCLHNEPLLVTMVLSVLITCTLQTTYTLLHDQIPDRRADAWSEELIREGWLPLWPFDYAPWLLSPPQGPGRAPAHILELCIKLCGDYPTMDQSESQWDCVCNADCLKYDCDY